MKGLILLLSVNFLFQINAHAMGLFSSSPSRTEAGVCTDCDRRAFQGRPLSPLNVDYAAGSGGSIVEALQHFETFAKNNATCRPSGNEKKYGLVSDLSRGTGTNQTYIVEVDRNGKTKIVDTFRAGEGVGVGNECGSNESPHGFMKMGAADYRADIYRDNPVTGQKERSRWPQCGDKNSGFQHNRIRFHGLEPGYNDNLSETDARKCSNGEPRYARLHPISYDVGSTTQGCKGMPLDMWCKWAPKLINGCAYNYDGGSSPAIKKLSGKSV